VVLQPGLGAEAGPPMAGATLADALADAPGRAVAGVVVVIGAVVGDGQPGKT
jgi:hypothetical protein